LMERSSDEIALSRLVSSSFMMMSMFSSFLNLIESPDPTDFG
jgi:hypothetical protein